MIENTITIEDATLIFRNFAGKEGQYNRAGDRNFAVFIDDPQVVEQMVSDGWNIKYTKPRDDQDDPRAYLQVTVGTKGRPPKIVMVSSNGKTFLDENTMEMLDWAEIKTTDLIIRPYNWEVNGKSGVKAYLKSLYVTLEEDDLDRKYGDVSEDEAPF